MNFELLPEHAYKVKVYFHSNLINKTRIEFYEDNYLIAKKDAHNTKNTSFVFYTKHSGNIEVDNKHISQLEFIKLGKTLDIKHHNDNPDGIYAALVTIPSRKRSCEQTIDSLINQVDKLFLCFNGYKEIPSFINKYDHRKIEYMLDSTGYYAAAAKLYWSAQVKGYYFTCDDDIIYPKDYIKKSVNKLKHYNNKAVISYHGNNYKWFSTDIRTDRKEFYKFPQEQIIDKKVHVIGTGVCAFHSSLIDGYSAFSQCLRYPRSIDLAFSIFLRKNKIKKIVLQREHEWLKANYLVQHGLHEQKQLNENLRCSVNNLLFNANPWVENKILRYIQLPAYQLIKALLKTINKNRKLKKLINNPLNFFADSKIISIFKKELK